MGLLTARIALFAVVALVATAATAQTVVSGTVQDTDGGAAISGARIQIHGIGGAASRGTFSDSRGRFRLRDVQPGAYALVVSAVGYAKTLDSIVVKADEPLVLTKRLTEEVSTRDEIVITASRYEQKASEAPASISVVDARAIQQRPTNTPVEQIKGQAGVDMAQTGVSSLNVNVRGFNNAFSGALMTLTDYRVSGVPSLRANIPYFIPLLNEDIERMELVRGPGSALYGPNAAQGVLNIISRSPFSSQGTTLYMSGGNQSLISGGIRHAGSVGDKFGYKVSGQYFNANEWAYVDPVEQAARASAIAGGANPDTLKIGQRINTHERFNVEARVDYAVTDEAMITVSGGMTQAMNSIELTDVGASNARNWRYYFANAQLNWNDLFIQTFYNKSDAGSTYLLRSGAPIIDRSDLFAARLQHASRIADRVRLTYGGDFFLTRPETDGTITGRYENEDSYSEVGAYVQADADIIENKLHALFALRGDKHSMLIDPVFSPRAALLYKIDDNHTVRGTFNQAFTTPTTTDMFLDFIASQDAFGFGAANPAWAVNVRALGPSRNGFQFDRIGNDPLFHSQFSPD